MKSFPPVLAVAVGLMNVVARSQVPTGSWDTPRQSIDTEVIDGAEYVRGELVLGLRSWEDFAELDSHASAVGDEIRGGISRLLAVRIGVAPPRAGAIDACLGEYSELSFVTYAERNAVVNLSAGGTDASPDDTYYPSQWHLENTGQSGGKMDADIDAPEGWGIATGSASIVVAVVDSGINIQHPEFQGRLLPGWDFVDEDSDPTGYGHGNWVAGVLAANTGNAFEIAGIDHRCTILPVKVGNGLSATVFDVAQGIDFAADQHVAIVNMSLVLIGSSQLIHDAVMHAFDAGCIQIAGAGNTSAFGSADKHVPAKYPEVMSIGWTDDSDERVFMSATGTTLDFVAPGNDIDTVSSIGDGSKKVESGSSLATPVVAAIGAILKGLNPYLSFDQVYEFLRLGAEDQVGDAAEDSPGWDPYYGWGRVNLSRSLEALCGCQGGESLIASPQHASIAAGEVVALRVDAGREHAGQVYWILGSASGPGTWPFGPLTLPVTPDDYSRFTLSDANGAVLANTHALLDANGQATGFVMLPKGLPVPSPALLSHVAVVFDGRAVPAHAVFATNVTTTTVNP